VKQLAVVPAPHGLGFTRIQAATAEQLSRFARRSPRGRPFVREKSA